MADNTPNPQSVPQVMVSSTFTDLIIHRAALVKAILQHKLHPNVMEYSHAKPEDVIDSSLNMVRDSAAYFGLISFKYGQTPDCPIPNPNKLSLTELEFNEAQKLNRPIYLFIMGDDHDVKKKDIETDPEKRAKLDAFRERAKKYSQDSNVDRVYAVFNSLEEFKEQIAPSLSHLTHLLTSTHTPAPILGAPSLPQVYLNRAAKLDELKSALLDKSTSPIGLTGIGGMPGVGKTILATALAHDLTVQAAFPIIHWLTFGQLSATTRNQTLLARMSELADHLHPNPQKFDDISQAKSFIEQHLPKTRLLLILDDIWAQDDAEPFLFANTQLIITTRNQSILRALNANSFDISPLSPSESLQLLADWTQIPPKELPQIAKSIAKECGQLPLALAMIGALIRRRISDPNRWQDALDRLQNCDLDKLKRDFPQYQYESLLAAMQVSVDALDDALKTRYFDFSLFREDALIDPNMIKSLWEARNIPPADSADILESLTDLSLLQKQDPHLKIHNLQLDYLHKYAGRPAQRQQPLAQALYDSESPSDFFPPQDLFVENSPADHLQSAVRLSENAIKKDKSQLLPQLLGRLSPDLFPWLQTLKPRHPAILPRFQSLIPPKGPLIRTFEGHKGYITSVVITPDGKRALSGSEDNTLKLWDLESGKEIRSFTGHSSAVSSVAITPDGKRALSVSYDFTLKLWDLKSGKEIRLFTGHSKSVTSVAITPDGKRALSVSDNFTFNLWDLKSGKEIRSFTGHSNGAIFVAITPDGKRALSGSWDNTLKLWDLESGKEIRSFFTGRSGSVISVAITPDGKRALSVSDDNTLKLWDLESGKIIRSFIWYLRSDISVAITPDCKRALSGFRDNTLKLWDLDTGKEIRSFVGHSNRVNSVAITPDGKHALSGSQDKTLKLWDLESGKKIRPFTGHSSSFNSVAITSDGKRTLSGSDDHTLKLWDLQSGEEIHSFTGHTDGVTSVAIMPNRSFALSGSRDKTLKLWYVETGDEFRWFTGHSGSVNSVAITPDGKRAFSGSDDLTLKLWDVETGKEIRSFSGHSNFVNSVAITPDGKRALSGDVNTIKLRDLETGLDIRSFSGHSDEVISVAITPDGKRALSGSYDKTLKLWDMESGNEIRSFSGHSGRVTSVALTSDGKRALSGSLDNTLMLWDLSTGECLATFTAEAPIRCCAISPDGAQALAGDNLGHLHFLRIHIPSPK